MDRSLVFMFRKFDPVMRMIISRDSGLLNDYFSITKGQLIDLYAFATYEGEEDCNTEETFPEGEPTPIKDLTLEVPLIHNVKEMRAWMHPLYIIEDYTKDYETYNIFQQKIYNVIRGCFTIKNCRNAMVRFKFTKDAKEEYELPFKMFIINTILWYPFVELHGLDVLDESFILRDPDIIPNIEDFINEKLIKTLKEYHIKTSKTNYAVSEVLFNLRSISIHFSLILGLDFSIPMFTKLYSENPRIKEIMECHFDETMQPHEIEQELSAYQQEFIEIISNMDDCHLGIVLRAKTGIKAKQLAEFSISEGLKPDLTGQTIPIPIQNSTLIRGADTPSFHYIDATAARKSLVMNKKVIDILVTTYRKICS